MAKAALVIIYNHQFNKNIEPLETLYSSRFSKIVHLIPFYRGNKKNVVPIYENSYYFQGYIAQAWLALGAYDCDDFLFIGDDLLLNPVINEKNHREFLSLDDQTSFIPNVRELHRRNTFWKRCKEAVEWQSSVNGLEVRGMLPSVEEALAHYERHGLKPGPLQAYLTDSKLTSDHIAGRQLVSLPYPLIGSYSDIFAVPRTLMNEFSNYCGIFAATRLFVELAIPSALAMASPKLASEANINLKGRAMWTSEDMKILEPYERSLSRLVNNFPENYLYLHPIKLSQWSIDCE
jgi:hypothetical protein